MGSIPFLTTACKSIITSKGKLFFLSIINTKPQATVHTMLHQGLSGLLSSPHSTTGLTTAGASVASWIGLSFSPKEQEQKAEKQQDREERVTTSSTFHPRPHTLCQSCAHHPSQETSSLEAFEYTLKSTRKAAQFTVKNVGLGIQPVLDSEPSSICYLPV